MTIQEQFNQIVPGKTYPSQVEVIEKDGNRAKFLLQSYIVGMYCAIYFNNATIPAQTGDHNNKSFVSKLKKDLIKALDRGAIVTIGEIRVVKVLGVL